MSRIPAFASHVLGTHAASAVRSAASPSSNPRPRKTLTALIRIFVVGIISLVATAVAAASPAYAAGGGFNSSFTYGWNWGDCHVNVGVVRDVYTPWASIGGSNVTCSQRHSSTTVAVVLLINGSVVQGSTGTSYYTNSLGTGGRITETGRFCGAGKWAQRATVTISGLGSYVFTTPAAYVQTQCR